jgi:hypothetical protein
MNLAVDDQCRIEFDNLKFRKSDSRYIVYKIQSERIVHIYECRLLKK